MLGGKTSKLKEGQSQASLIAILGPNCLNTTSKIAEMDIICRASKMSEGTGNFRKEHEFIKALNER